MLVRVDRVGLSVMFEPDEMMFSVWAAVAGAMT